MWLSLCLSSPCRSASLSLNVALSLWLTAGPCSCWQLCLPPQDNISSPYLSLHPSASALFLLILPSSSPPVSYSSSLSSSSPLPRLSSLAPPLSPLSSLPPVATPTIRSHLSVCTSAIRASWQPNASHVPKLHTHTHTHTQRLCPDKTAREQITP